MNEIGSGYRTLDAEIADLEAKLAWATRVAAARKQLNVIADIVKLGCLWTDPRLWDPKTLPTLRLIYTGREKNHVDAAAHLSRILEALRCPEFHLKVLGGSRTSRPHGEYQGEGKLGRTKIKITLEVSWLPPTCQMRMEELGRTWTTNRRYSVYCRR